MKKHLQAVLSEIKAKTGVGVAVYDFLSEKIADTGADGVFAYKNIRISDYENGLYKDEKTGFTYFVINVHGATQPLTGVVEGVDEKSCNYAYMVSSIVENAFRFYKPDVTRDDVYRNVLLGKFSVGEVKSIKERYEVDEGDYYVFAIRVEDGGVGEVMNFLSSFSTSLSDSCLMMEDDVLAYVKHLDFSDVTSLDFASMLSENISSEISRCVSICVGSISHGIEGFGASYAQAVSGLRQARAFGYTGKVFSYKEFLLVDVLEKLPCGVVDDLKRKLLDASTLAIFADKDMTKTAEVFMNHSLNISETARSLYLHRNTLMYRLDKIERDTGLNIRVFSDAVIFRLLEILYTMYGGRNE